MAKPFLIPDPGPGGGSTSSGAGPPNHNSSAGGSASSSNASNVASGASGHTAPATPALPPGGSIGIPMPGTPGHVPSAPIPMGATGNAQYHLQQMHHHHQQLQNHYHGGHGPAPLMMPGTPGTSAGAGDPHAMLPMTPPASGFATAVQTPQMTPVNEQLVQALYEAIYRCSMGDGPPTPLSQSPPSASCSPFATGSYYGTAQVFFPRTPASTTGGRNGGRVFFHQTPTAGPPYPQPPQSANPTPVSANSHSSSSGVSSSGPLDTPSCSSGTPHYLQGGHVQPVQFSWQDDTSDSSESEGSTSQATTSSSSSGCSPHCHGMDGGGSLYGGSAPSSTTLISPSSSGGTLYAATVPPHLDYMAGREQLQEFPGKIPQRKRKSRTPKAKKPGLLDQPLMWQMAVTAALIVLGCGYLAAR